MYKLGLFFIFVVIIHAIYNLINYFRFKSVEKIFFGMRSNDKEKQFKSISFTKVVKDYIKNAGVPDKTIPVSQSIGFYQIANSNASILTNITSNRQDISSAAYELLLEAKGIYWSRFINSINPLYWLKIVLYIPKYILSYLGLNADSIIIKISQLIYWIFGILFTIAISVFSDEVKSFILSFIK